MRKSQLDYNAGRRNASFRMGQRFNVCRFGTETTYASLVRDPASSAGRRRRRRPPIAAAVSRSVRFGLRRTQYNRTERSGPHSTTRRRPISRYLGPEFCGRLSYPSPLRRLVAHPLQNITVTPLVAAQKLLRVRLAALIFRVFCFVLFKTKIWQTTELPSLVSPPKLNAKWVVFKQLLIFLLSAYRFENITAHIIICASVLTTYNKCSTCWSFDYIPDKRRRLFLFYNTNSVN